VTSLQTAARSISAAAFALLCRGCFSHSFHFLLLGSDKRVHFNVIEDCYPATRHPQVTPPASVVQHQGHHAIAVLIGVAKQGSPSHTTDTRPASAAAASAAAA
jgi:hypothetical protein